MNDEDDDDDDDEQRYARTKTRMKTELTVMFK